MRRRSTLVAAIALALLAGSPSEARVPCASGGPPIYPTGHPTDLGYLPRGTPNVDGTALVSLLAVPWAGRDASRRAGDAASGSGFDLDVARIGACGGGGIGDRFAFRLIWEPFSADERARVDHAAWGRLVDAQLAWLPFDWLTVAAGVMRVPFSRGREQPDGARSLPTLPWAVASLAPDRRLGGAIDADLGVFRLGVGVFEGARLPSLDAPAGALLVARAELEPFGPVGRRAWPEWPSWTERLRPATGLSGIYRVGGGGGWAVAADLALAWRRLFASGEVLIARDLPLERPTEPPSTSASPSHGLRIGAWLEALVVAWSPYLSLAARADWLDEDLAHPGRDRSIGATAGATALLLGPQLQLQAGYTHRFHLTGSYEDDVLLLAVTIAR